MEIEIFTEPLHLTVYGFSSTAPAKNYSETAFRLMGQMWEVVKTNNIKNKGLNIWVYEQDHKVFAGVELTEDPGSGIALERKEIVLPKYARYKHTGPYHLIKQAGQNMTETLRNKGYEPVLPHIEIYGHWTNDESKLETDLLMSLR